MHPNHVPGGKFAMLRALNMQVIAHERVLPRYGREACCLFLSLLFFSLEVFSKTKAMVQTHDARAQFERERETEEPASFEK